MVFKTYYNSPVGNILIAAKDDAITGLWIEGQKYYPSSVKDDFIENKDYDILQKAEKWLDYYFAGKKPSFSGLTLAPAGSNFAINVWKILCEIPYGETMTYGEIAKKIAAQRGISKMSAQAVGNAVGHNPISIIIPCHRVVGMNGNLTGYAGGIDKKIKLLSHEGVSVNRFYVPKKRTL